MTTQPTDPGRERPPQRESPDESQEESQQESQQHWRQHAPAYLRFAGMILTGMVVMYWTMFAGTYRWSHVEWSESRLFMTLTMGGTMGLVMLAWMLGMYRSRVLNVVVVAASVVLLAGGVALDRSQVTVQDSAFMRGMIPHHSLAITRSERADLTDVRVCELAVEISEAQRREILEMQWLIRDIAENGEAGTPEEAAARPVPDFTRAAVRGCPQERGAALPD